jgi:UDP-N-acetylmuramate--alanine ligase
MYRVNFDNPIHVYFMGIGGISMSGLAEILLARGFAVSGSDLAETELTAALAAKGARIFYGQRPQNLAEAGAIDLVVYTAAITADNPEFLAMQERGLAHLTRAELLGQIMGNYPTAIAVAGTHGKTTTTGMVAEILRAAGLDPTLTIGGLLDAAGGNIRIGQSGYFVTEACEYTNSFLSFLPRLGLILNMEADHLDFFKDIGEIRASYRRFAELLPADGALIICGDLGDISDITAGLPCPVITYGKNAACDYRLAELTFDEFARPAFSVNGERYALSLCGEHNALNAAAAIALADYLGIDLVTVREALAAFTGVQRRFERKGEVAGFTIIDDYAHHPTEIVATLSTARRLAYPRIWCVFQPHTYTRTKALLPEFASALALADRVIVVDIYAAREQNTVGISGKDLADALSARGSECYYIPTADGFAAAEKFILENLKKDDLLITMGAGDVVNIGENLLKKE